MKEGLDARLQLITMLATTRQDVIKQVQPGIQTKAHEVVGILKDLMVIVAATLPNPEPSTIALTEQQLQLAVSNTQEVLARTEHIRTIMQRIESVLMVSHMGLPILDWTPEERAAVLAHVQQALSDLQQSVGDLM